MEERIERTDVWESISIEQYSPNDHKNLHNYRSNNSECYTMDRYGTVGTEITRKGEIKSISNRVGVES